MRCLMPIMDVIVDPNGFKINSHFFYDSFHEAFFGFGCKQYFCKSVQSQDLTLTGESFHFHVFGGQNMCVRPFHQAQSIKE